MSGLLLMATAAIMAKRHRDHYRHSVSRTMNGGNHSSYGDSGDYSYREDYLECVIKELFSNEELNNFFEMLLEEYQKEQKVLVDATESKLKEMRKKEETLTPNFDKLANMLKDRGVILANQIADTDDGIRIAVNNYGIFSIVDKSVEDIINHYKVIVESEKQKLASMKERLDKHKEEIDSETKKLKFTIFKREEKKDNLDSMIIAYNRKQRSYDELLEQITALENFINMSDEEKDLLNKSFPELKQLHTFKKEYWKLNSYCIDIKRDISSEVMKLSIDTLIAEGKITQTTLEKIYLMLDKVEIKARRGEYKYSCGNKQYTLKKCVEWFIKNIYEEDDTFVERNYFLPEENEAVEDKPAVMKLTQNN